MANGKLSRAQVGLALASAFVVLFSSGIAISRISEKDDESPVATGPSSTSSTLPGLGQPGPATSSGPASGADTGGVAEQPAAASGEVGSEESAVVHGVTRSGRKAAGGASTTDSSAAAAGASTGSGSGSAAGPGASGGGSAPGGGAEEPPAPNQLPPDDVFAERMDALLQGVFEAQAVKGQDPGNDRLSALGRLMTRVVTAARQFAWEDAEELWPLPRRSAAWDAKEASMDAVAYLVGRGLLVDLPG